MKSPGRIGSFLSAILLAATVSCSGAATILSNLPGEGPGLSIGATPYHLIEWGAVGFTPAQTVTLSSVSLWLSGYDGLNGQQPDVSIWSDTISQEPSAPHHAPANQLTGMGFYGTFSFSTPAPNDGSLARFTFDCSVNLTFQANITYWLVVDEIAPPPNSQNTLAFSWVGGDNPTGSAAYNGSQQLIIAGFSPSSTVPAFSIDVVPVPIPEPASLIIAGFACLCAGTYALCFRRKTLKS